MGLEQEQPKKINLNTKFESFGEPLEEQGDKLFVNAYRGHYFQNMELNRRVVERTLKLAHLDGQVFLTSLSLSGGRSLDGVNTDGSIIGKKTPFFGEKLDPEKKNNPYYKVASIPQGWKIEINDQKIMDRLLSKRIDPEKSQKAFINNFDNLLAYGLVECIVKEKLSSIKDKYFESKLMLSISIITGALIGNLVRPLFIEDKHQEFLMKAVSAVFLTDVLVNSFNKKFDKIASDNMRGHMERVFEETLGQKISPNKSFGSRSRKTDHFWEYIMPPVEIDKVAESYVYLNLFGRQLVREKR